MKGTKAIIIISAILVFATLSYIAYRLIKGSGNSVNSSNNNTSPTNTNNYSNNNTSNTSNPPPSSSPSMSIGDKLKATGIVTGYKTKGIYSSFWHQFNTGNYVGTISAIDDIWIEVSNYSWQCSAATDGSNYLSGGQNNCAEWFSTMYIPTANMGKLAKI